MELLVFPVIYFMWRGRQLRSDLQPTSFSEIDERISYIDRPSREQLPDPYAE